MYLFVAARCVLVGVGFLVGWCLLAGLGFCLVVGWRNIVCRFRFLLLGLCVVCWWLFVYDLLLFVLPVLGFGIGCLP